MISYIRWCERIIACLKTENNLLRKRVKLLNREIQHLKRNELDLEKLVHMFKSIGDAALTRAAKEAEQTESIRELATDIASYLMEAQRIHPDEELVPDGLRRRMVMMLLRTKVDELGLIKDKQDDAGRDSARKEKQ